MNKVGVAYNLFDGIELLEGSIKCIRDHVDYVCVIFQTISNWGNEDKFNTTEKLKKLYNEKLIDEVFLYKPILSAGGHINEIHKRQIGLEKCLSKDCDIFMSMDCDEFYKPEQFKNSLELFKNGGYDGSACQMLTYYHDYEYQIHPPEQYYVPLFYRIQMGDVHKIAAPFPVLTDPTRRLVSKSNIKIFERDIIEMHHMSYVRESLKSFSAKLHNSSASVNFSRSDLRDVLEHYENWKYPMNAKTIGMKVSEFEVRKVDSSWIVK